MARTRKGWPPSIGYPRISKDTIGLLRKLRKSDMFIVDDEFLPLQCDLCKRDIIATQGNRATYFPETRVLQVLHYECSWNHLFGQIYSLDGKATIEIEPGLTGVYINGTLHAVS